MRTILQRNSIWLAAFFLPGLVYIVASATIGIYPFGGLSLLISDLNTQYIDFLSDFQRLLHGNGSFFYAWHAGLGLNNMGLIAYYLASPFNLLLFFFPESAVLDGVSLIILLKLCSAGLSFGTYLRKRDFQMDLRLPLFALFYALSGYVVSYAFNIMWLDGVILLPLLCGAIEDLIQKNRWGSLTVLFFILFISQFYIGYMVGIFCAMWFLVRLFCQWEAFSLRECIQKIVLFCVSAVLAAGMSAFLLLPCFFVLKDNMGLIGQNMPQFGVQFAPFDLLRKLFIGSGDGMKGNLPHVFCGLLTFCCLPPFFFSAQISKRVKITQGLLLLFLWVSMLASPLDFFWHAFDYPSWFPYRYSFLFSFVMLTCACEGMDRMDGLRKFVWYPLFAAGLLILFFILEPDHISLWMLLVNLIPLCVYAFSFWFTKRIKSILPLLLICAIFECGINAAGVFDDYRERYAPREAYLSFRDRYRARVDTYSAQEEDFFRMEKSEIRAYNDPMSLGFPGLSHFSSTASVRQSAFLKKLGYDCYATWCTYAGGTFFSDSLLGIRYIMADEQPNAQYKAEATGVWRNPEAFPLVFFVQPEVSKADLSNVESPLALQDDLMKRWSGEAESSFTPAVVEEKNRENMKLIDAENGIYQRIDQELPARVNYLVTISSDSPHYLYIPNISLSYDVWINNERQIFSADSSYSPYLVNLGGFAAGEQVLVTIDMAHQQTYYDGVFVYELDRERVQELSELIRQTAPQIKRNSDHSFSLTFPATDSERLLMSSIPFDSGWQARAQGEPLRMRMLLDSLVGIDVPQGCSEIELWFTPRGWYVGLGLSLASLLSFVLLCLFWQRRVKTQEK